MADRVGLRHTLVSALAVSTATYVALGLVGGRVGLAFAAIGALFVAFEVTVVVLIALASTVTQRGQEGARLLGTLMAAIAFGNAAGAVAAPLMFARGGIALSGVTSAGAAVAAAAVIWAGSRSSLRPARDARLA